MQSATMQMLRVDAVNHEPMIIGQLHYGSPDFDWIGQAAITVVGGFQPVDVAMFNFASIDDTTRCPRQKNPAALAVHLRLAVDRYRVVILSLGNATVPRWRRVIRKGSRIASDIDASPPNVNVLKIGMSRSMSQFPAARE
jgi:hypothetical protein